MERKDLFQPVYFEPPQEAPSDDYIIPVFCRAVEPVSDCASISSLPPTAPTWYPPMTPAPEQAIIGPSPEIPMKTTRHKVSAYDIAQELLSTVRLLLVNECLFLFDGQIYRPVTAEVMKRIIMSCCRMHIKEAGTPRLIEDVYKFLQTEPQLVRKKLQENVRYVAFRNGLLDLESMQLGPFTPDRVVTYRIEANYLPDCMGHAPTFDAFVSAVCGNDSLLRLRLLEMIGYTLVPDVSGKVFFLAQGVPNSGKSVLGELLASFFDEDVVTATDFNTLGRQFGVSDLFGKRLSLCMDLPGGRWDTRAVGQLKNMTGNDLFSADIKYLPRIKFRNTATFWFGTNHPVVLAGRDPAFLQRMVVLPFRYPVPPEKQDRSLLIRLQEERDAIAFRAIQAYLQLRRDHYRFAGNFRINEIVAGSASDTSLALENSIVDFFASHCSIEAEAVTFLDDLYAQFTNQYPGPFDPGTFSNKFFGYVISLFPGRVRKVRKRRQAGGNPISAFEGLSLLDAGGEGNG